MKHLVAALVVAFSALALAPVANAETCADVQAAIAAHNHQNNVFPDTVAGHSAGAAYDREAAALESRQSIAC